MAMPQPAHAPQLAVAHVTTPTVPDLRHIWLPSQRSLCELAVRRVVASADEASAGNAASRDLPACEACIVVTEMLSESARHLTAVGRTETYPPRSEALSLLGTTTWPWVSKTLIQS